MDTTKDIFKLKAEKQLELYFKNNRKLIFPDYSDFPSLKKMPKISIVIVTYTQTALELMCLQSILQNMSDHIYEVIISNNGKSESNRKLLDSLENAVVIHNGENLGFVRGVNIGAAQATGDYLFLLNDDAMITSTCITSLLNAIHPWRYTNVGVVGGQIRTLDNKIQDAGGILWRNGAAAEYCKTEEPDIGDINFVREVDYVSGACFMTPRQLFEDLGGFDEEFSPGYCEESDYCCRVRESGFKIIYEPAAKLIHYEYGSSDGTTVSDLVAEHTKLLYSKHEILLKKGYDPSTPRAYARTTRHYSGRVLIINDVVPHSYLGEESNKLIKLIYDLTENNFFVTLFPIFTGIENWESVYKELPSSTEIMLYEDISLLPKFLLHRPRFYDYLIAKDFSIDRINLPNENYRVQWDFNVDDIINKTGFFHGKYAMKLANGEPFDSSRLTEIYKPTLLWVDWHIPEYDTNAGDYAVYSYCSMFQELGFKIKYWSDDPNWSKQDSKYIKDFLAEKWEIWNLAGVPFENLMADLGHTIDLVVLGRPLAINYIKPIRNFTKAPIIYYCHDLHYLRERRMATILNRPDLLEQAEKTILIERKIIEETDLFVAVSEYEKDLVDSEFEEVQTSQWPWYTPMDEVARRPEGKGKILFLGGLQHTPNLDAIKWFINDIYPIVKKELEGNVQLDIIGSKIPQEIWDLNDDDSICVRGFVEQGDLASYFTNSHLLIAPIRFGAGFKGKIAMAMSYGLPVVTTGLGAEGMGIIEGEQVWIANIEPEFAEGIVNLITQESLWDTISSSSLQYAREHWAEDVVKDKLIEDIKRLDMALLKRLSSVGG